MITAPPISAIDEQSAALIEEFNAHFSQCLQQGLVPKDAIRADVFCGWVLQKVAALQLLVAQLYGQSAQEFVESYKKNLPSG